MKIEIILFTLFFVFFVEAKPFSYLFDKREDASIPVWDYPQVRRENISFTYQSASRGSVKVEDAYNWLEKDDDKDLEKFKSEQIQFTNDYLRKSKDFEKNKKSIQQAINFPKISLPKGQGNPKDLTYVYTVDLPNKNRPIWYLAKSKNLQEAKMNNFQTFPGKEFFDENLINQDGSITIDSIVLSPDGKLAAYVYDDSSLDTGTIYIRNVDSPFVSGNSVENDKTRLSDKIINYQGGFFWTKDSSSIVYVEQNDANSRIRIHHLGNQGEDEILLDSDKSEGEITYNIFPSQDHEWMLVYLQEDDSQRYPLFVTRIETPIKTPLKWISFNQDVDYTLGYFTNLGNDFYFSTNKDAAKNYKMVRVTVDPSKAKTIKSSLKELNGQLPCQDVIPEHSGILQYGSVFLDGLVMVYYTEDARHQVYLYDLKDGKLIQRVLPDSDQYIQDIDAPALGKEIFILYSTFNKPFTIKRFTWVNNQLQIETMVSMKVNGIDLNNFKTELRHAPSLKDKTQIPYTLMYKKDFPFDGTRPALVIFFGSFGIDWYPYYDEEFISWVNNYNGILISINARGGDEVGNQWHEEGMLDKHQNTFDDILGVTNYLVEKKIVKRGKIILRGGGAGGMNAAVLGNQAPEGLIGAVIADRSAFDLLRIDQIGGIGGSISYFSEFGDSSIPIQFDWLDSYSPLQNVKNDHHYPLFLLAASNDPRHRSTTPKHAYKMISELQSQFKKNPYPMLLYLIKDAAQRDFLSPKDSIQTLQAVKQSVIAYALELKRD